MKMLIKNGYIINGDGQEELADILMESGVIMAVGKNIEANCPFIDVEEKLVLPGFVDMNCDICDPGYESREDIMSVSKTACKGGFTSITCKPSTNPVIDNKTSASYVITRSKKISNINVYAYGSMTKELSGKEIAEIGEMVKAGVVAVSDGGCSVADSLLMRNIMLYTKMFDIPIICTCDDETLSKGGVVNRGKISASYGLNPIPREAEEAMVARNIVLARHSGAKVHLSGITTSGSVEMVRFAKSIGVNISCETSPQYFTLTEDNAAGFNTMAKLRPPLRCESDVEAIKEGLKDGTIDVISSGHAPDTIDSKFTEFDLASAGISSLETAFPVSYDALVKTGVLTLSQLIDKFCRNPVKILNLQDKGEIMEGYDGDLTIFDKNFPYTVKGASFASKAKYSPYEGLEVSGKIIYTIVHGEIVYLV